MEIEAGGWASVQKTEILREGLVNSSWSPDLATLPGRFQSTPVERTSVGGMADFEARGVASITRSSASCAVWRRSSWPRQVSRSSV